MSESIPEVVMDKMQALINAQDAELKALREDKGKPVSELWISLDAENKALREASNKYQHHNGFLIDGLDLMRDEFKRFSALLRGPCLADYALYPEIDGICERAVLDIERTAPVIKELEGFKQQVNSMVASHKETQAENKAMREANDNAYTRGFLDGQKDNDALESNNE
jgi:regulator of replication initiation timing